jgi:hypothetical protein
MLYRHNYTGLPWQGKEMVMLMCFDLHGRKNKKPV